MTADDFALPVALEAVLAEVCDELAVPARELDAIRQLLATPPGSWPACCRGSCQPCVDEHKSIARVILARSGARRP